MESYVFFFNQLLHSTIVFARNISGHGKFETLGALGISGALLATGGGIAWHSLDLLVVRFLSSFPFLTGFETFMSS